MQISTYKNLKSSGSAWLGNIPAHWGTKKLKFLATVQPSNVDKKTVEGEEPVILCNYTDAAGLLCAQHRARPREY